MYTVTLDNALIHNPAAGDEACLVLNGVITKKVNCADSFSFTIYPANPAYSVISLMVSKIKVYKDGTCIFSGRPLSEETDFDNGKTVLCESDFAVLNDTIMRPYEFQGTVGDYVRLLVNAHNEATTSDKQITVGSITVTDPNNNIVRSTSDYVTVMEELIEKTVNNMGGYLRMIPGTMTLDYLQDSLDGTNQTLEIGKNILDFNRSISTEALATALIPLGKEDEETGERVTIKSVNGGSDFISDQVAENERGRIYTTMTWDDVSVPANLLTKARAALTDLKRMASRIEMSAVDLKEAGLDVDSLDFFEYITVVDAVHNVSGQYLITERKYNLSAPENDMVTFGGADNTISGQTSSARSAADRMGARIVNTLSDIIERQTDLIKGGDNGNVVIATNEDGEANEIFFLGPLETVETARKVLRINSNGIGFSTSGINGPYSNAWTIDGNLNASFIHTGILRSATNTTNWWNLDTGEINISDNANIAGWKIKSSYLGKRGTLSGTPYLAFIQAPETPTGDGGVFGLRTGTEGNYNFPFIVRYNGTVEATNAVIEGTITTDDLTATGGTIGGWTIGTSGLSKGTTFDNRDYEVGMWSPTTPRSTTPAFYVGYPTGVGSAWEYVFKVDYSGKLTATGGGTIGAWTLTAGAASSSDPAQGSFYSGMPTIDSASEGVYLGYDGIALGGGEFKVTRAGDLTATSATIRGNITATSGAIGGWTISGNGLTKDVTFDNTNYQIGLWAPPTPRSTNPAFYVGYPVGSTWNYPFKVDYKGVLTAIGATISGTINMTGGSINMVTSSQSDDKIKMSYSDWTVALSPLECDLHNSSTDKYIKIQAGGIFGRTNASSLTDSNAKDSFTLQQHSSLGGTLYLYNTSGNVGMTYSANGMRTSVSGMTTMENITTVADSYVNGSSYTIPSDGWYFLKGNFESKGNYNLTYVACDLYAGSGYLASRRTFNNGENVWSVNSREEVICMKYLTKNTVVYARVNSIQAGAVIGTQIEYVKL